MDDMLNVYIGLGIILYFINLLGASRLAIKKGYNGAGMFVFSLFIPVISFIAALQLKPKPEDEKRKLNQFDNIILELAQPFIDLFSTSKALFGLNLSYTIEGLTYFGVVGLLAIFFNNYVKLDDIQAAHMVVFETAGITIAMLFLGATVDWIGLRKSLIISLVFMLIGRIFLSASPAFGGTGMWSRTHLAAMFGLLGIVVGYGIYMPAAYAGVKQLTTEKTAATAYAMFYGLMNLGGFLPAIISPPIRKAVGIAGEFWVYAFLTVVGIAVVYILITKKTMKDAIANLQIESKSKEEEKENGFKVFMDTLKQKIKEKKVLTIWICAISVLLLLTAALKEFNLVHFYSPAGAQNGVLQFINNFNWFIIAGLLILSLGILIITDVRFFYFVFILIPVQTLFAHNWLTLPQYTSRAFSGFVQSNFEFFVNLNPIFIFILTPMVAALTSKRNTYNMMIAGTFVMASPTFILAMGPSMTTLMSYLILMTIGEAMWQPRFLQWVAEIAPKSMTGIYMGIGQFPWFLTKVVTGLYSGWFLMHYCPVNTPPSQMNTEFMWLIYGVIAIISPIGLVLAKGWMSKGFKDKYTEEPAAIS